MNEPIEEEKVDPRVTYLKNLIAARGYKNIKSFSTIHGLPNTTVHDLISKNDLGKTRVDTFLQICSALETSPAFILGDFDTDINAENIKNSQLMHMAEMQEALTIREQGIAAREKALINRELEFNQRERELLLREASLLGS